MGWAICVSGWVCCALLSPGLGVWTGSLLAASQLNQPWLAVWWHVCTTLTGWLGGTLLRVCVRVGVCVWIRFLYPCVGECVGVCMCVCRSEWCTAAGWLLGYAWKTSGMCWCLHFSPLTGSICWSTIKTVLDRLSVRDPDGFLHIWQCLALLPGESRPMGGWLCCGPQTHCAWASGNIWILPTVTSFSTCFSNFTTPTTVTTSFSSFIALSKSLTPAVYRLPPPPQSRGQGFVKPEKS